MKASRFSALIITILNVLCSCAESATTSSYKVYSKSSSSWKTCTYLDEGFQTLWNKGWSIFDRNHPPLFQNENNKKSTPYLSTPEECARPCLANSKPKTCYYHWIFEFYHTLGGACKLCQPNVNTSISTNCQCILADGTDVSGFLTANRMYPGPPIEVCLGDSVIVDVENMIPGNAITIHWHGLYQKDWQHYDGVPFVTQCPIPETTTFRYQWRAQNAGTHFWHAHTGLHKADGLHGAIVVRQPIEDDPNGKRYDIDNSESIMFLTDWMHQNTAGHFPGTSLHNLGQNPDNFLINGHGQWTNPDTGNTTTSPFAVFNVKPGLRYRLRVFGAFSLGCPGELTIQNHNLTIISVDGENVKPKTVSTLTLFSAERIDVILNANQSIGSYWIHLRGLGGGCAHRNIQQHAILRYVGSNVALPNIDKPSYRAGLPRGIIFNQVNQVCDGTRDDVICIKDLQSSDPVHKKILQRDSDVQVFVSFFFQTYDNDDLFRPNTYQRFVVTPIATNVAATLSGISHKNPPSPLISQFDDIPKDYICNTTNLPSRCANTSVCQCAHVIHVPLNAVVDLITVDGGPNSISHPFHLHGFGFHVMAQGLLSDVNITEANKKDALRLHRKVYPASNKRPPTKDTLAVASGGYTIVRFIADNPGWWLYHCHFLHHIYNGMTLVIHVGEDEDLPPTPEGFPTCGNYLPQIYQSNPRPRGQQ